MPVMLYMAVCAHFYRSGTTVVACGNLHRQLAVYQTHRNSYIMLPGTFYLFMSHLWQHISNAGIQ